MFKKCRCKTEAIGKESWEEAHTRVSQELANAKVLLSTLQSELERDPHYEDYYKPFVDDIKEFFRGP